jgi:hypothetical protein
LGQYCGYASVFAGINETDMKPLDHMRDFSMKQQNDSDDPVMEKKAILSKLY